ncbi:HDOD domain-containing protein [Leptothrix sp. BB-4]
MIAAEPATPSTRPSDRTRHLFRRSARAGEVHPLQRLIGLYREHDPETGFGGLEAPSRDTSRDTSSDTSRPTPARPVASDDNGPWRLNPEHVARRVGQLPALPQAVLQALALLRSETASNQDCAQRISLDTAMTARTLRLANSAFYGVSGRVATIRDAVLLLGRRAIGTMLAAASVADSIGRSDIASGPGAADAIGRFWRHALASALAAQILARRRTPDQDVAFTAGLLHDIGQLVLRAHHAEALLAVRAAATAEDAGALPFERALLGLDHAEVGAMVARHWHFPPEVIQAIGSHHDPAPGDGAVSLADLVHMADALAHALDLEGDPDAAVPEVAAATWRRVALGADEAHALFHDVETGVRALSRSLLG